MPKLVVAPTLVVGGTLAAGSFEPTETFDPCPQRTCEGTLLARRPTEFQRDDELPIVVPEEDTAPRDPTLEKPRHTKQSGPNPFLVNWDALRLDPDAPVPDFDALPVDQRVALIAAITKGASRDADGQLRIPTLESAVVAAINAGHPPAEIRRSLLNTTLLVATDYVEPAAAEIESAVVATADAAVEKCPEGSQAHGICVRPLEPWRGAASFADELREMDAIHLFYGWPKSGELANEREGEPDFGIQPLATVRYTPSGTTNFSVYRRPGTAELHSGQMRHDKAAAHALEHAYPSGAGKSLFRFRLNYLDAANKVLEASQLTVEFVGQ